MTETDDSPVASPETIRLLMMLAVVLTVGLTATAFWLSYEHLHDVSNGHGLSGARAWAWPATVDAFIIIGEVMILVAHLLRQTDGWAVFVTVVGSVGSIALNVAGVGEHAPVMTYIVAAVPPCGALLAFAILMRQVKKVLTARRKAGEAPSATATDELPADDGTPDGTRPPVDGKAVEPTLSDATEDARADDGSTPSVEDSVGPSDTAAVDGKATAPSTPRRQKAPRSGVRKKAPRRSLDEWVPLAGPIFHAEFNRLRRQPTANEFAKAIEAAGHGSVSDTTAKTIRSEILDRADVPALAEEGR